MGVTIERAAERALSRAARSGSGGDKARPPQCAHPPAAGRPETGADAMPMIDLTLAKGALPEPAVATLVDDLLTALLRWEGAPDNQQSRSLAWAFVHVADAVAVASSPSG